MKIAPLKLSLFAALAIFPGLLLAAPIPLTGTMVHNENFDSFGTSTRAWTNDSTLAGWFAQISTLATATGNLQPTDGTAPLTALLNCGTSGSTDRAFGSKPTGAATSNIAYAVSFRNAGANPILFAKLNYTGELWRTNTGTGTPLVAVDEIYTVFYRVSSSAVTDILAGPNSATAAPGAGFTALGAGANWISPVNTPLATATTGALDGNDPANRTALSFSPASSIVIHPGQFLMIKWTDSNVPGTDGFQAIDDVSVEFTELTGSVSAAVSARTRDLAGTPFDATDDTFGFTATITGTGALGPNWIASDVSGSPGNASSGPYGTPVAWTGFPIGATKSVLISDVSTPALNTTVFVDPPPLIGSNNLVVADAPILQEDNVALVGWTIDDSTRTLTQTDQAQGDKVVNSQVIDLSTTGFVQFTAELDAITGATGFEAADSFALRLIIDGGTPISVLGAADVDASGRLTGRDDTQGAGPELPGNDDPLITRSFSFRYLIPDTANSVRIRIIGNSNSDGETFLVKNIRLGPPPPSIYATLAGPSTLDNKGTVDPADDQFSAGMIIVDVNIAGSTTWDSDSTPATGLYATALDTFGPFPVSGGAKPVSLFDRGNAAITTSITIPLPPAPTLTASAPANIIRIENGPGTADDSMAFDVTITGTNGGPGWLAAGASPDAGSYGPVTFTIPAPLPPSPATVTVADVSYPGVTLDISVPVPQRYIIGQRNLGGGLMDVETSLAAPPAPAWGNDSAARTLTLTMTTGLVDDSVVTSEVINLSGAGIVYFTANLNAREISDGSNFESNDRFKAELIIDGGTAAEQIINLVTSYDRGNGDPAVGGGGGPNGPPDGYINGYQGIALAPATGEDDYNANRIRDEFNLLDEVADTSLNNNFPLSYTIPAAANTVQLKIYGVGPGVSETFLVSGVLFSSSAPVPDSDGDGVSNAGEIVMGTDPDNAGDVLRLSQNAGNPGQLDFPTKPGRFYRVYVSNDIDGQEGTHLSIWKDAVPLGLAAGTITGDGNPASFTISIAAGEPRRFYRLHVMQTDGPLNDGVWPATVP